MTSDEWLVLTLGAAWLIISGTTVIKDLVDLWRFCRANRDVGRSRADTRPLRRLQGYRTTRPVRVPELPPRRPYLALEVRQPVTQTAYQRRATWPEIAAFIRSRSLADRN